MNAEHLPGNDQGSATSHEPSHPTGSDPASEHDFGFGAGIEHAQDPKPSGSKARKTAKKAKAPGAKKSPRRKAGAKPADADTAGERSEADEPPDAGAADESGRAGTDDDRPGVAEGPPGPPGAAGRKKAKRARRTRPSSRADAAVGPDEEQHRGAPGGSLSDPAAPLAAAPAAPPSGVDHEPAAVEAGEGGVAAPVAADARARKKRKRSRGRKKAATAEAWGPRDEDSASPEPLEEAPSVLAPGRAAEEPGPAEDGGPKRRRRGRRGGRRRKRKQSSGGVAEGLPGEEDDLVDLPRGGREGAAVEAPPAPATEGGKRKRKRSRRKKKGAGEADWAPERPAAAPRARKRRGAASEPEVEKTPEEIVRDQEAQRTQVILVNAVDREEKRVAVVEDGRIVEFLMTSESQMTLVNDIYRGKVVNLEPAIGAAFVDFGQGRNGFLHTSDVLALYGEKDFSLDQLLTSKVDPEDWDESSSQPDVADEVADEEDPKSEAKPSARDRQRGRHRPRDRRPIGELIRVGDPVVIQVTKDAIGDKGPTLTTYISIPGRYLVLMPSMSRTGVSRKIADDKERKRLKKILSSLSGTTDMGVIVRTAGVGQSKAELQRDLDYLLGVWESLKKRLKQGRGPAPLYLESDVAVRTLRDLFDTHTKRVVVDDPMVHEQLIEFAQKLMPEHVDRIVLHTGDRPLFHHYGIEQDFERIFARRVELPSGGSIVFDQAEALVAIDVNSGRTRTDSFDFEEIALKTNLEAVPEIARQIRLRDLGGILVCDFIDMQRMSSNRTVERALRDALATDRARSKMGRISQFGLLELTRQRLGPGTHKKVFQTCPRCRGTARIRTVQSRAQAILRRLGSALTQKGFSAVELRAAPEVVDYLKEDLYDYVRALEHRFEREIRLVGVADQAEDSVLRYMRTDGREVRPGGRRKR